MKILQNLIFGEVKKNSFLGGLAAAVGGATVTGLFNRNAAQDQMQFQEEMSNTAHQREVEDLRKAGLNPILSAKFGGSSTPSGASYAVPDFAQALQSGAKTMETKEATKNKKQENINLKAVEDKLIAEIENTKINSAKQSAEQRKINAEKENVQKQNKIMDGAVEASRIEAEIDKTKYGKAIRYLNRLNPFGNSAKGLWTIPKQ